MNKNKVNSSIDDYGLKMTIVKLDIVKFGYPLHG